MPDTQPWITQLQENTQAYQAVFEVLSPQQLNYKPAPDRWSAGQCIDHIITTNRTYFPILEDLLAGTYPKRSAFLAGLWGWLLLRSMQPTQHRKMKTVPVFEPSQSTIPGDILQQFQANQQVLIQFLGKATGIDFRRTIIASPANRRITYSLAKAMDIIIAHEKRHLLQAQQVLNEIGR